MNQKKTNWLYIVVKNGIFFFAFLAVLAFALISPTGTRQAQAKVKLNYSSKTLPKGWTLQLKVKGTKKKVKVTWKSSNKKVAKVSKKGIVTAKKKGKATITAKIRGKGIRLTRKVKIKVVSQTSYFTKNKKKLYDYVVKHGKYDKNIGAWYMAKTVLDEVDESGDGPRIVSNVQAMKGSKTIRFTVGLGSTTPDDNYHVMMTMKYNETKPGILLYDGYPMDYSPDNLEMNGSLDYSYDGKSAGVHWTHQKYYSDYDGSTTESNTVDSAYAARGNYLIGYGFKGWNAIARKAGISMKDIGFINYK